MERPTSYRRDYYFYWIQYQIVRVSYEYFIGYQKLHTCTQNDLYRATSVKYWGVFEVKNRRKDAASSVKLVSTIAAWASPKKGGQNQVSGRVSVHFLHA